MALTGTEKEHLAVTINNLKTWMTTERTRLMEVGLSYADAGNCVAAAVAGMGKALTKELEDTRPK